LLTGRDGLETTQLEGRENGGVEGGNRDAIRTVCRPFWEPRDGQQVEEKKVCQGERIAGRGKIWDLLGETPQCSKRNHSEERKPARGKARKGKNKKKTPSTSRKAREKISPKIVKGGRGLARRLTRGREKKRLGGGATAQTGTKKPQRPSGRGKGR